MEECFKSDMHDINGQYIGRWFIDILLGFRLCNIKTIR